MPVATLSIMGLCCSIYVYQFLLDPTLHHYTMCPRLVVYLHEYYRIITSALFHVNLMHIGMNMMSTLAIGTSLERRCGTLYQMTTVLWGILLTSAVYIFAAWLPYAMFGYANWMSGHSVGFSGVIFQLSVLEASLHPEGSSRSVFGLFRVPSKAYPWALLVALQFIMPQVSFLGHLSGILVGTLQGYGMLDVVLPTPAYLRRLEEWSVLAPIVSKSGFVRTPPDDVHPMSTTSRTGNPTALVGAVVAGVGAVVTLVKNVGETLWVCIFGRGREANGNIQLGNLGAAWGSNDAANTNGAGAPEGGNVGDDENWSGLPPIDQSTGSERSGMM